MSKRADRNDDCLCLLDNLYETPKQTLQTSSKFQDNYQDKKQALAVCIGICYSLRNIRDHSLNNTV